MKFASMEYVPPGPAVPVVTLDDFKTHARLMGITVGVDDALLTRELQAAITRVESWMRRTMIERDLRALFVPDIWRGFEWTLQVIALPRGRVAAVKSVTMAGVDIPVTDGYTLDEWGIIKLLQCPTAPVTVLWTSGFGPAATDVPEEIKEAVLEYATALYEDRRGNREIKATSDTGPGVPTGVQDLLRPFQIEISG